MTRIPLSDFLGGGAAVAPTPKRMKLEDFLAGGASAPPVDSSPTPLSVPFVNQPTPTDPLTQLLSGGTADPDWMVNQPPAPPVQGIPAVQGVLDDWNLSGYVDPSLKAPPSFELPDAALTPTAISDLTTRQREEEQRAAQALEEETFSAFTTPYSGKADDFHRRKKLKDDYYSNLPVPISSDVRADKELFERYRRINELSTGRPLLDTPYQNIQGAQAAIDKTLADMKANGIDDPIRYMQENESFQGPQGFFGRQASALANSASNTAANVYDALRDPPGDDTFGTRIRQQEAAWREGIEDIKDERSDLPNWANEVARTSSQAAPQLAAAAAVGMATKNPSLALATMLGPSSVEAYQVGRANGLDDGTAAGRAIALAGVEIATMKLGGAVAKSFGGKTFEEIAFGIGGKSTQKGLLNKLVATAGGSAVEGGEEVAAGVAQQFGDFVVGLEDELVGDETPEQLALSFAVGFVAAGSMNGISSFSDFVENPTVENAEAAGITEELAPTQVDRESLATAAATRMEAMTPEPVAEDAEFELQPGTEPVAPEPIQAEIPPPKKTIGKRIVEAEQPPVEAPPRKRRIGDRITAPSLQSETTVPSEPTPPVAPPDAPPVAPSQAPADSGVAKEEKKTYDYSSTQVNLPPDVAAKVLSEAAKIPDADLAEDGRESEPHVTVKYGLETDDGEAVRALLADEPPIRVKLGKTSIFEASESGGSDVVKVEVTSPDLRRINKKIADNFPNKDTHPTYNPHVTLAYVKPGEGKKYVGNEALAGQEIELSSISFRGRDGSSVDIPLTGAAKKTIGRKKAEPAKVQDETLPDWVTEDFTLEAPALDPKQKTKLKQLHRRFKNKLDKETHDQLLEMPERDQHYVAAEADRRADTANEFVRQVMDDYNQLQAKGSIALISRNKERAGKDASRIPGFDQLVQQLRDGDYPSLASYAESRGQGELEAGLFDIVQGGKKALESQLVGPESQVFDVLEEYRERLERSPTQEGGEPDGQVSEAGFDDEPSNVERAGGDARQGTTPPAEAEDFKLSGEGSTDTSPIVEPYKVAEKDRLPPKRKSERQPQLDGLPEDLDESVLAGQQGLQFSATTGEQLQPSKPKVIVTPPKSQREIIGDLAKTLDIPIRFGRLLHKQAGGTFFRKPNLIALKKANDVPVATHEVGHKLDAMFKLSSDKAVRSELNVLGDPATPGSQSSWTKSKTNGYKLGEGVAEFIRYWMTDPAKAKADAPNMHAAFEAVLDANKDLGDALRQTQQDIRIWRTAAPQARLRSQISIGDNPNKTRYSLSQLTRDVVDDLHYLKLATEDAKVGEPGLQPSKNPYLLARNLRGSYGMASTFIQNGVVNFNSKDVALGTSLEDALKPVGGRINDFRDWIVAKRAQELESQGRATGLVKSDIDAVVKKFAGDAEFEKAFTDVKKWNSAVLQYAIDASLVTKESAAAIRKMNQDYVPFHRLFEVGANEAPSNESTGKGSGLNPGKPGSLKQLKGSTRNIVDPLETMVKNAYAIITASEKSAISLAVADMAKLPNMGKWVEKVAGPMKANRVKLDEIRDQLEAMGADLENVDDSHGTDDVLTFFRQATRPPKGENTISVVRDGKPEFYRLNRYLHDTFEALDLDDAGKLVRILSAPAQLLRAGVTLEPGFNIANMMRDTFGAAVVGKYGALPFETTLRGIGALINNPQLVAEWAASGGRSSVEANYFDRGKMQKYIAERISKDLTPAERALIIGQSPLKALRWLSTTFEEATRIGEYQKAYDSLKKSGMPDGESRRLAAFEARDRQDFAKGGAKTKILRHVAAFWNAQLQANVRLAQAFKERPAQTIAKGLAFVTLPKLLEQALNWDDEDYWQRPQWERDVFYMIPMGKDDAGHTRFLRIPIPFEIGILFGTIPGRFLEWAKKNDPEAVKDIPGMFLKQTVPIPNPSGAATIMELLPDQGYSYFRGREIVPDSMADMPKDLQWTQQTSSLAKKIGDTFGFSPMKVDYFIESTTGGLGKVAMGKQVPGERFVSNPLANVGQPINDFYEIRDKLTEDAERIKATGEYKDFGPVMLAAFEEAGEKMGALRNSARETTDPIEKAKLEDEAYQMAVEMVAKYRENNSPEEAVVDYAERHAERVILSSGLPHKQQRRLGSTEPVETEADYEKRVKAWKAKRDIADEWLKSHKETPAVKAVIAKVAKKIPAYPEHRGDKDFTYGKRVAEWKSRYSKSAEIIKALK